MSLLRPCAINAFVALLSLTLTLLCIECGFLFRSAITQDQKIPFTTVEGGPAAIHVNFNEYHPVLGFTGIPGVEKRVFGPQPFFGKVKRHNASGHRGPAFPQEKQDGTSRILLLGDSNVWGYGLDEKELLSTRLSASLKKAEPDMNFEVINLGVSGYGTGQAYLKFLLEGLPYQPDVVSLNFFSDNDFWETTRQIAWKVKKPRFFIRDAKLCLSNIPPKIAMGWPNHTIDAMLEQYFDAQDDNPNPFAFFSFPHTWAFIKEMNIQPWFLESMQSQADNSFGYLFKNNPAGNQQFMAHQSCPEHPLENASATELIFKIIETMQKTTLNVGADFFVLMTPSREKLHKALTHSDHLELSQRLADAGISNIDLLKVMQREKIPLEKFFLANGTNEHHSAWSNQRSAELLTGAILPGL
jgi:hypothetical protein